MERPLNVRSEYQHFSVHSIQDIQKSLTNGVSVLLFNIRTDGNVGMILRQACCMGFSDIILCGRRHYDKRFTVGSHNYINVVFWETPLRVTIDTISPGVYSEKVEYFPEEFVKCCENKTPIFIEQHGKDIREVPWKLIENPLIIMGNESVGIPHDFIKSVKKYIPETLVVRVPQWSVLRSMNVAMAASIVMWEINK